jgi:hypothetical protein
MDIVDLVFFLCLIVTIILVTLYEALTLGWTTGEWFSLRQVILMCLLFAVGVSIWWIFPKSIFAEIAGWVVIGGAAIWFGIVPAIRRISCRLSKKSKGQV